MKKSDRLVQNGIQAIAGRFILVVYRAYSALFIKKEDFAPPYTPARRQEIIFVKRVNNTYSIASRKYIVQ